MSGPTPVAVGAPVLLQFDDNSLLPLLYGEHDQHLARIEQRLGVSLVSRGNRLAIEGPPGAQQLARATLDALYDRLRRGRTVGGAEVDAALRMAVEGEDAGASAGPSGDRGGDRGGDRAAERALNRDALARFVGADNSILTRKRHIFPRTPTQGAYIRALMDHELVFGLGPAGTGKTYLAVGMAVAMLLAGRVDRIILSRPAVEAGERLGYLPGDLREKVDPYLRPLYDALYDMLPADQVVKRTASGEIEVAPLAFMRGRTLANAFVILDEAQNTTPTQMKMFLTRLGENGRMAVTGDPSQIDLPRGVASGLDVAQDVLRGVEGISFVRFTKKDVVRHPLVTRIVSAYESAEDPALDLGDGRHAR
ncbi:MAG: PhoH family protein [Alphaproteobacteria bacterium]|nr:PhoH family protein [Alphaproteobacteria bacterium]